MARDGFGGVPGNCARIFRMSTLLDIEREILSSLRAATLGDFIATGLDGGEEAILCWGKMWGKRVEALALTHSGRLGDSGRVFPTMVAVSQCH